MVEAAGVEPASEGMAPWDSTCVSALYISPPVSKSGRNHRQPAPKNLTIACRCGARWPAH